MTPPPIIERFIYALLIVLSLIALLLVFVSPADIVDARVVYQGF